MKKIFVFVPVLVFALSLGVSAMELGNGVTLTGVAHDDGAIMAHAAIADRSVEGVSPGGLRPELDLGNGITVFEPAMPAGKPGPALEVYNGITEF